MTESLINFFSNMPINHWSSVIICILALMSIAYTVYFFFSKEGKDERGKHIISTAGFISFIITVVLIFIYGNLFYKIATSSLMAYSWLLNSMLLIVSCSNSLSILILKKKL